MTAPDFHTGTLTLAQVRRLHRERMRADFPPDELKPLAMIERALARDVYACYGALDGDEILAYAFFVRLGQTALLDYLAVRSDLRDSGVGSRFLRALMAETLQVYTCALLEVDDPDAAPDAREVDVRTRRLNFYLRNGLTDTGVRAEVWGVRFRILKLPLGEACTPDTVRERYAALYHSILPERVYARRVFIR